MNKDKWTVSYGIHRGTLVSRDSTSVSFDTEKDAREFMAKTANIYRPGGDGFGYLLWFMGLWNPDGEKVESINGYPYH